MVDLAPQHVGDGLYPPMGMPWESLHVEVRLVGAEVVKQQEGIVELGAAPTNRAMKVDASAFDGRAALDNLANQPVRCHGQSNLQQDLADTARFGKPLRACGLGKRQSLRDRQPELASRERLGKAGKAL